MTLELPTTGIGSDVSWRSPARGLWVATRRGEHAGMVERLGGAYRARNARGRQLGSFDDLDSAREAIDGGNEDAARASRRLTTLLWLINVVAAVVALGLAFALLR